MIDNEILSNMNKVHSLWAKVSRILLTFSKIIFVIMGFFLMYKNDTYKVSFLSFCQSLPFVGSFFKFFDGLNVAITTIPLVIVICALFFQAMGEKRKFLDLISSLFSVGGILFFVPNIKKIFYSTEMYRMGIMQFHNETSFIIKKEKFNDKITELLTDYGQKITDQSTYIQFIEFLKDYRNQNEIGYDQKIKELKVEEIYDYVITMAENTINSFEKYQNLFQKKVALAPHLESTQQIYHVIEKSPGVATGILFFIALGAGIWLYKHLTSSDVKPLLAEGANLHKEEAKNLEDVTQISRILNDKEILITGIGNTSQQQNDLVADGLGKINNNFYSLSQDVQKLQEDFEKFKPNNIDLDPVITRINLLSKVQGGQASIINTEINNIKEEIKSIRKNMKDFHENLSLNITHAKEYNIYKVPDKITEAATKREYENMSSNIEQLKSDLLNTQNFWKDKFETFQKKISNDVQEHQAKIIGVSEKTKGDFKIDYTTKQNQIKDLNTRLETLTEEVRQNKAELQRVRNQSIETTQQADAWSTRLQYMEEDISGLSPLVRGLSDTISKIDSKYISLHAIVEHLQKKLWL